MYKLKDDCRVWLDTQHEKFVSDYTAPFRTNCGDNRNLQDINMLTHVIHSDNMSLMKAPSREEVKQALFFID